MHIYTGTDIIEVDRIKESIEDMGDKFINKIFTQTEIDYCKNKKTVKYQHYAARFAAKEATFKAISTLLSDRYSISWKNSEIVNDENGKPRIQFIDLDKKVEKELRTIKSIDVSLSHLKEYAIANVTLITE